jgi:hypothetical protein
MKELISNDIFSYIFKGIKIKELNKVRNFNVVPMIQSRTAINNPFYYYRHIEKFEDCDVLEVVRGNEDLLLEYIRKVLIKEIEKDD